MDVFQRVNIWTIGVSALLCWVGWNFIVGGNICSDNSFFHDIMKKGEIATDNYFAGLSPICALHQSAMDSRFVWHQMSIQESFSYAGIIIGVASSVEIIFVYFRKEKFPINDQQNGLGYFLFIRIIILIAFAFYLMNSN